MGTPIQPIPKRNKDFTHKTPIITCSKFKEEGNKGDIFSNQNITSACRDLSLIVDDIITKNKKDDMLSKIALNKEVQKDVADHVLLTKDNSKNGEPEMKGEQNDIASTNSLRNNPFLDDTLEDSFDRMCL